MRDKQQRPLARKDLREIKLPLTSEKDKQIKRLREITGLNFRQLFYFLTDWLDKNSFPIETYSEYLKYDAKNNVRKPKKTPK